MDRRIDAYLVCAGKYHDFDFARLELLKLLAADEHIRVQVAQHFGDLDAITSADFVVTYTCDLRPSADEQEAIRGWVERGGRWLALHGTNCALDPGPSRVVCTRPHGRSPSGPTHSAASSCRIRRSSRTRCGALPAGDDPLVAGIESFEATDELYLMEHHGDLVPLLETRGPARRAGSPTPSGPTTSLVSCSTADRSARERSCTSPSATAGATGT